MNSQVQQAHKIMMTNILKTQTELMRRTQQATLRRGEDLKDSFAGGKVCHGKFLVNGSGEARKVIQFPIAFYKPPVLTFGFEVDSPNDLVWTGYDDNGAVKFLRDENQPPALPADPSSRFIPGEAPIITAFVFDWIATEKIAEIYIPESPPEDRKSTHITGAEILTVCEGPVSTKYTCHWSAAGFGMGNPSVGPMTDTKKTGYTGPRLQVQWKPGSAGLWGGVWYEAWETPPGYGE